MRRTRDDMTAFETITRRTLLGFAGAGMLSACAPATKRPNPSFAPIRFSGVPIPIAVNGIELVVRPRPAAGAASPADADFVVPPEQIARLWPQQRVRVTGGPNKLRYVIDDASAVSRVLEDGEVVVAAVQVRLLIVTPAGVEEAAAAARVDSETRFDGFPNMVERQEALHRASQDIAAKLDAQLTQSVTQRLGAYISA